MPAVRPTESFIPRNNPQLLGEVGTLIEPSGLAAPGCQLIGYLKPPVTMGSTNTYVVFVTDPALAGNVASYEWSLVEETAPGVPPEVPLQPFADHPAVLEYRVRSAVPFQISVRLKDHAGKPLRTLRLRQQVRQPYQALERLLQGQTVEIDGVPVPGRAAVGLTPETSREVLNDLFGYIRDAFEASAEANKVPLRLLAAVVWLQAHRVPKEDPPGVTPAIANQIRNEELEKVATLLNGEGASGFLTDLYDAIGVSQISAATAAMIVEDPAAPGNKYTREVILPSDEDQRDNARDTILDNYQTRTDVRAKVDLYNLLRFPKSNIALCFQLLNYLKNRPGRFSAMTTAQLLNDDGAMALVATEFEIGATASSTADAKPNEFGQAVTRLLGSPLFALGLGGNLQLGVSGKVFDHTDRGVPMTGARVDVYVMMLYVDVDGLKCFRRFEGISTSVPDTEKVSLTAGETLPVLEVRRQPTAYPTSDLVKVRKISNALDLNEGWVVIRSGNDRYATLLSRSTTEVTTVQSDHSFTFKVDAPQPLFIRVVKPPDASQWGYFDGELGQVTPGLPAGWVLPPAADLVINQIRARHMVQESVLVDRLRDWLNYSYATNLVPDYPAGYHLPALVPQIREYWFENQPNPAPPPAEIQVRIYADHQIACNTFVEALVIEAWRRSFAADFTWSKTQHDHAMFLQEELEWMPAPVNGFNPEVDPFSPAWVYVERILDVTQNPTANFTIQVNGVTVAVTAGGTNAQTATNIATALRANAAAAQHVVVKRGVSTRSFVTIRPATAAVDPSPIVRVQSGSGRFTLLPASDAAVFPAVRLDLPSGALPPPWTVVQGWHLWAPQPPPPKWDGIKGHNLIVVSADPKSGKVLTLEANLPDAHIAGVGFRGMGTSANAGNINNFQTQAGGISPSVTRHWVEKIAVEVTWDGLRTYFGARLDGTNPMGLVRLKVYDCQWAAPYLYATDF
jgi:hypothetical protein